MIVYKCKVSGDELFSDSYPCTVVEDFFFEVVGKNISISNKIDESLIGANASAEEGGETTADTEETKINVIHANKLQPTSFDKKSYQVYIKEYIKNLTDKITAEKGEDAAAEFKGRAVKGIKKVLGNFANWEFYTGESMAEGGMVVLMDYQEDGITPYFWFIKEGIQEEKY